MTSKFDAVLELVEELSVEELRSLNYDDILYIVGGLSGDQVSEFMFVKNIKIFGGINGYVDNFLSTGTIAKIRTMPEGLPKTTAKEGAIKSLNKMLTYPNLSDVHRVAIEGAIVKLNMTNVAPATGRRKRKTRRRLLKK
jgi:hypothetical protein